MKCITVGNFDLLEYYAAYIGR